MIARALKTYAILLIPVGLSSVLYNSQTSSIGWNPAGITGLAVCLIAAAMAFLFLVLHRRGVTWARWAAVALTFILLGFSGQSVFKMARDPSAAAAKMIAKRVEANQPITQEAADAAIRFRMGLFGVLGILSLSAFMKLWMGVRRDEPPTA
jgi:hypothetical protein